MGSYILCRVLKSELGGGGGQMGAFNYVFPCNLHAPGFIRCAADSTPNTTSTTDTLASPHICANLQHCQLRSLPLPQHRCSL